MAARLLLLRKAVDAMQLGAVVKANAIEHRRPGEDVAAAVVVVAAAALEALPIFGAVV